MTEVEMLRERIAVLERHIAAGINCGFFCALPECAKFLQAGEDDDKVSVGEARPTSVERASCSEGSEPF
jgi:hypothetical protein